MSVDPTLSNPNTEQASQAPAHSDTPATSPTKPAEAPAAAAALQPPAAAKRAVASRRTASAKPVVAAPPPATVKAVAKPAIKPAVTSKRARVAAATRPVQATRKPEAPPALAKPAASVKPAKAEKPAKPAKAAKPVVVAKPAKAKPAQVAATKPMRMKEKLVRDSFTMPRTDFALIQQLKDRAMGFRHAAKKSELLRAGLHALAGLSTPALKALLAELPALKSGRPKKGA